MRLRLPYLLSLFVGIGLTSAVTGLEPEVVRFETLDGVKIVADYYATDGDEPAPVVILLHMYRSNRAAWKPLVPALHQAELAVLAIDLRGHGESVEPVDMDLADKSKARDSGLFNSMHSDVEAAYYWLSRRDDVDLTRVGLVGASVGCSIALDYASRDRSVDAVVCMTAGENYLGVDSKAHIARLRSQPVLLLATTGERKASDALGKRQATAVVDIVGGGTVHGTRMFGRISGIEERITTFLVENLGEPASHPVVAAMGTDRFHEPQGDRTKRMPPRTKRWFSSPAEAEKRGLSPTTPTSK
ncbi:MAG: alpha/beta fold hydrolase [Planctomycetes bacterium]|nr:alpha/beta fold hydrolase [Planctomycetota bacterium]